MITYSSNYICTYEDGRPLSPDFESQHFFKPLLHGNVNQNRYFTKVLDKVLDKRVFRGLGQKNTRLSISRKPRFPRFSYTLGDKI